MNAYDNIVRIIVQHYPAAQAIYLFGSYGTPGEWLGSDVDIAILLPVAEAQQQPPLWWSPCHQALSRALRKEVDLINLRQVSTTFQKEIIHTGRQIYVADAEAAAAAAAEFEMLTASLYQKLNEERREILAAFQQTGRAYAV